jgi:hypothetical protein
MGYFREKPEEVKKIFDEARKIEIKPVKSMADTQFDKHGREFHKDAIKSVLRKDE